MPRITIDQREVEVPPGATILQAAEKLGIEVPTLCFLKGVRPLTSCLVCMVKLRNGDRLVPACGTLAEEGMEVESETEEVHQVRRSALELLLSDHLGDCLAPCYFTCPAQMDIPRMLRQIASDELGDAIVTVKRDIALPGVLGRICPAPCEKACRRKPADGAVAICRLKRFVADVDLAAGEPYLPPCKPDSGKRVAIVGAGPTGLSAAYYLQQRGHACTVIDENEHPGGRLLRETTAEELPRDVLEAEIRPIVSLGAQIRMSTRVEGGESLEKLRREFDAVLIACGATSIGLAESWGLQRARRGIRVDKGTYATDLEGVFAAGNAIRTKGLVVRSVADGKQVAVSIDRYLCGRGKGDRPHLCEAPSGPFRQMGPVPFSASRPPFSTKIGRLEADELGQYLVGAAKAPRREPSTGAADGFAPQEAAEQAARCMHCDCRRQHDCKLRFWAIRYQADPQRYQAQRRAFRQDRQHGEVIFEPGKCIRCGLCIEIASAAGEPLGLTFVGRGFDVRVDVPLNRSLDEALRRVAAECVAACPTAALARQ